MLMKKEKNYSYLTYNIVCLGKIAGKRFESLATEKICCYFE